ncbi:hypothetical protein [Methylobacterium adhaesivum]|uniref:Uncharacterized protein n=1 Tax=Methylobacterium adhaesivum TaxID=333297 RepID=A0ABT8BJV5_9HYPH|nr:hypothetical protein [Methylobacterium adhaesivum]MDN3591570.1 hypothetical protein [Methylobacterium adhaesivum]
MLKSVCLAIAGLFWSGMALAETVETTSSIGPEIEGIKAIHRDGIEFWPREILRRQNIESIARMGVFEQRLAGQARRSIRSLCDGCVLSGDPMKVSGLRRIVNPRADEMRIDDPAQAPLD